MLKPLSRALAAIILLISCSRTLAVPLNAFDAGFLKGARILTDMISVYTSGRGNVAYHAGTYSFRASIAEQIGEGLGRGTKAISNPGLKLSLDQLAKDLRFREGSSGDIDYWIKMLAQQQKRMRRISDHYNALASQALTSTAVGVGEELGYLRGLEVGLNAILSQQKLYGDIDYHIRIFSIQRDVANAAADAMARGSSGVKIPLVRFVLEQLVLNIRAVPQSGHGDLDYWTDAMSPNQRIILARVRDEFKALANLVERDPSLCEDAMSRPSGPYRFDLKDI